MNNSQLKHKGGFTLVELLISIGVVTTVITLLVLSFVQITKLLKEIEIKRAMAIYAGNIVSTLSNDLDDYFIKNQNPSQFGTLELQQYKGGKKVQYTIEQDNLSRFSQKQLPANTTGYLLHRSVFENNVRIDEGTFSSDEFLVSKLSFQQLPEVPDCSSPPSLKIDMHIKRVARPGDYFQPESTISTILTNGGNPLFYADFCSQSP